MKIIFILIILSLFMFGCVEQKKIHKPNHFACSCGVAPKEVESYVEKV
jgi:hypothetical protein